LIRYRDSKSQSSVHEHRTAYDSWTKASDVFSEDWDDSLIPNP
jgi:hypothetical protein